MAEKLNCRLREILDDQGLVKTKFAARVGTSKTNLTRIINGGDLNLSLSKKIARRLGLSVYDIWPDESDSK